MKMPKILMVTRERSGDRRYGLGKSLDPVLRALVMQGASVGYLTQEDAGSRGWSILHRIHRWLASALTPVLRGTEVHGLAWGVLERVNMGRLAAKVARTEDYSHIHCHDPLVAWGLRWALRFQWGGQRPRWGVTEHGFGCYAQAIHEDGARLGHHAMRAMRALETRVLRAADWVVCPTHLSLQQLQRDLSLTAVSQRFQVIPHACPQLPIVDRATARFKLGLPPNAWVWLAVGRLAPLKAFDLLLDAFASLGTNPDQPIVLCIAGGGDVASLRAKAETLRVSERLIIAETNSIAAFYAAADAYISTSRTESFGMANLEALCLGLPVLATGVGGVPEVLGGAALYLPMDAPSVWASQMARCQQDAGLRAYLTTQALHRAAVWPTAERVALAYLALYAGNFTDIAPLTMIDPAASTQEAETPHVGSSHDDKPLTHRAPRFLTLHDVQRVLVFAPHADDESFGCGGLLALLAQSGVSVRVCILTDGALGDPEQRIGGDPVAVRVAEATAAMACLGVNAPLFWGLPDGRLAEIPDLTERVAALVSAEAADWIFFPNGDDPHIDHVATARAAIAAGRAAGERTRFFAYEVWQPMAVNRLLDISSAIQLKLAALKCYRLPAAYVDYSRAAEGLAAYRAIQLPQGRGFAEGFVELDANGWMVS
jgi:LmbE family N-acetylglucosaminyl deacetylase/glycosyltransferase involved in cell wall biosynthesis